MSSIKLLGQKAPVSLNTQTNAEISSSKRSIERSEIDGKINKNAINSFQQSTNLNLRLKARIVYNDIKQVKIIREDISNVTKIILTLVDNIVSDEKKYSLKKNINISSYLNKVLNKNDKELFIEISKIYFLKAIEEKIINFIATEKQESEFYFLKIGKLIFAFKDFYNLDDNEIPYIRYNTIDFINKNKHQIKKITQDKINLNKFSDYLKTRNTNKQAFEKTIYYLQKTVAKSTAKPKQNLDNQLDLTRIYDVLYFFRINQNQFEACNDIIIKSSVLDETTKTNYLIEGINREFDKLDSSSNSFTINYQLINNQLIYFSNQIKNLNLKNENKDFLQNILYAHLFSKIEKHINLLLDSSLLLDVKINVISEIIKNCNFAGLDSNKKIQVLSWLTKYNQEIYGYNAKESFKKLFPKFNFNSIFIINNRVNKNNLYSTKLIQLIRLAKKQNKGKVQFFNTSYAAILDILNSDIHGVYSPLENKGEIKFQGKYSLNEVVDLKIFINEHNIENSLTINSENQKIKDESKALETILKAGNFLHNAININSYNENGKILINALNYDNKEEIELIFKAVIDYLDIQKINDIKSTEIKLFYENMLHEITCRRIDDILNDIINSKTLTNIQKITFIDKIDSVCKQVIGLDYIENRNNSICCIKTYITQLSLIDLEQWLIAENKISNKFNFYHKFNNLINIEINNLIQLNDFATINSSFKDINNIYIKQMKNFAKILNLNLNDTKVILSSCNYINNFISHIDAIAHSDFTEITNNKLVELNISLANSVSAALDAFNKNYLRIDYLNHKRGKIKLESIFFMNRFFRYFINSIVLYDENIRYRFILTKIDDTSINAKNHEESVVQFEHIKNIFRQKMLANISNKIQSLKTNSNAVTEVADFIFKDGTNLDEMSNICLLNLAVDKLLTENPKLQITSIRLIEKYYSLLYKFTIFNQQKDTAKFLNIDGFLKFKKNTNIADKSYLTTNINLLYSEPLKKYYIIAKKQAHLISKSILARIGKLKAKNIDNNIKEFTIDFSKILQDNKITKYLDEKEGVNTSFSMYHEENILKMQMIINYLIDNIQINSLYLTVFIDTLFNLVIKPASTDEYDYKKLSLELDIIYQQLCCSKKNTSLDYTIREISNKLLTLI